MSSGSASDKNLYCALELGTKRIGHGLALTKHPLLRDTVKQQDIAIELCPVSNKILKYVGSDLRQHPFISFLFEGLPLVVTFTLM